MDFARETYWLFLIVPLLLALRRMLARKTQKRLAQLVSPERLSFMQSLSQVRPAKDARFESVCFFLSLALIIVALLGPRFGFTWKEAQRSGVDLAVAVDVSQSMSAKDISPSRLERAKREINDLITHLRGDRISLIAFAGSAFIECPLTVDYAAFSTFVDDLNTESIPVGGTNIEAAFDKALLALRSEHKSSIGSGDPARALLLLTDGENFQGDLKRVAQEAASEKILIFVIGIGTAEGAPLPAVSGFKKDRSGNMVISRLDEEGLIALASETGGVYVSSIVSDEDTRTIYEQGIKSLLEDGFLGDEKLKVWNDVFQLPLSVAIALLLIPQILRWLRFAKMPRDDARSDLTSAQNTQAPQKSQALGAITVLLALSSFTFAESSQAQPVEELAYQAKKHFESAEYEQSLKLFEEVASKSPEDARALLGVGGSYYRLQQFDKAQEAYLKAAALGADNITKSQAIYNAGNSQAQLRDYENAIKAYEDSLKLAPEDQEAKDNLARVKQLLEEQKKEQDSKKDDKTQDKEQKENKEQSKDDQEQADNKDKQQQEKDKASQQEKSKDGNPDSSGQDEDQKQEENKGDSKQQEQGQQEPNEEKSSSESQDKEQEPKPDDSNADTKEDSKEGSADKNENTSKDNKSEKEEESKQNSSSEKSPGQSASTGQQQDSDLASNDSQMRAEQTEALLGSVEESKRNLVKYRAMTSGSTYSEEEDKEHDW